jgi:predicted GNAT family acetyltransferase
VDVNVGYRFANVIYRDMGDGSLGVDHTIINDVLEQVGGGAEPLNGDSLEKRAASVLFM